jgi:hypothetical protein
VVGVKVAVLPARATDPGIAVPPGPATVKVVVLMVEAVIASLKVALIVGLKAVPVAPAAGVVEITKGAVVSGGCGTFIVSLPHPAMKTTRSTIKDHILLTRLLRIDVPLQI